MSSFKVILDACVLIPASLRDTLLRAAQENMYRVQFTSEILEEVRRNLSKVGVPEDKAQRLVELIGEAFPDAFVTQYQPLIALMPNHKKDRHVLAAAIASNAQVIVTQNLKDFPRKALDTFKIEAQLPDIFLVHMFYLNPECMIRVVTGQAKDLCRPPRTLEQVLETLRLHAPMFVSLIRGELDSRNIFESQS